MNAIKSLALLAFALLLSLPASARQVEQPCELHVFVDKAFSARGHFASFPLGPDGIAGHLTPYADVEALLREYLDPEIQAGIIRAADLPGLLKLDNYRLVVEPPIELSAAPSIVTRRTDPRLLASAPPCYAEFRVITQMYEKTALSRMLYSWLIFRQFDGDRIVLAYDTAKATQVGAFPPKKPEEAAAARTDIQNAFRANLLRFFESSRFKNLKR
jgi:hypothetical protein